MLTTFPTYLAPPQFRTLAPGPGGLKTGQRRSFNGDGHDILLQGFHWDSHSGSQVSAAKRSWYQIIQDNAVAIRASGFTWVWFPPPSDSLAPQGYLPRRWHDLDSAYGTQAQLQEAIRSLGPVRAMADLVLNHRVGLATSGADFAEPSFPDNRKAVTADDASGEGLGRPSTGEPFHAARNLDHTNPDVHDAIVYYLKRLRAVGFSGWRYDLVKGYHGRFVGEYNDATNPYLAVGELFENDPDKVERWIASTGRRSTAFDFPTRYLLFESFQSEDYSRLATLRNGRLIPGGLIGLTASQSVTFLDNHDTEYRRDGEHGCANDSTRHFAGSTVDMGYAYILTHPGLPCVFWPHFFDWGEPTRKRIECLMRARKEAGIHSRSRVVIQHARSGLYAAVVGDQLAVKLGSSDWHPGWDWRLIAKGDRFAVWKRDHKRELEQNEWFQ